MRKETAAGRDAAAAAVDHRHTATCKGWSVVGCELTGH
jgi:hypothetical protein